MSWFQAQLQHSPLGLFLVQACVVIVLARTLGAAMRRIGQPLVIAEVLAGILLGPSLLGTVAPTVEQALFPKESMGNLFMTSQIGLILFMFLIGLDLDFQSMRGRLKSAVAISHASIVIPFVLGVGFAITTRSTLSSPEVPRLSFILFMGVAMSITAFPVLARILVEKNLFRTRIGAIAISCAAVDDVTAWCILAFVVALVRAKALTPALLTALLSLVYIAFMAFVVRPVARRMLGRREGDASPGTLAAVIVALFVSALVTEVIGIHALFGAFVFGLMIPKENGLAKSLIVRLEDLVVVFMLPLFFAFSGLRTQLGLLHSVESWLLCLVVIGLACLGKFGGSTVAARLTGLSWRDSSAIGVLMNTRGLVELVVLNIGYDLGVISPTVFTMLVVMALVTTFMTSPTLSLILGSRSDVPDAADGVVHS